MFQINNSQLELIYPENEGFQGKFSTRVKLKLMKACIIYHPNSQDARAVEEYAHDFASSKGRLIELISLESLEGSTVAETYDIVQYPALLVTKDESNELVKFWSGVPLPLMDEVVSYYV